jgi:hypothetical protein
MSALDDLRLTTIRERRNVIAMRLKASDRDFENDLDCLIKAAMDEAEEAARLKYHAGASTASARGIDMSTIPPEIQPLFRGFVESPGVNVREETMHPSPNVSRTIVQITGVHHATVALCNDGTIWNYQYGEWNPYPPIPQPDTNQPVTVSNQI